MKQSTCSTNHQPTHEEILILAQQIYEEEGRPYGKAEAHWLEAERRLREQSLGDEQKPGTIVAGPHRERAVSS